MDPFSEKLPSSQPGQQLTGWKRKISGETDWNDDRQMGVLTILWTWMILILSGKKTWEIRSRSTKEGRRIALYESGTFANGKHGRKMIVGYATILKCEPLTESMFEDNRDKHRVEVGHQFNFYTYDTPYVYKLSDIEECKPFANPRGSGGVSWGRRLKHWSVDDNAVVRLKHNGNHFLAEWSNGTITRQSRESLTGIFTRFVNTCETKTGQWHDLTGRVTTRSQVVTSSQYVTVENEFTRGTAFENGCRQNKGGFCSLNALYNLSHFEEQLYLDIKSKGELFGLGVAVQMVVGKHIPYDYICLHNADPNGKKKGAFIEDPFFFLVEQKDHAIVFEYLLQTGARHCLSLLDGWLLDPNPRFPSPLPLSADSLRLLGVRKIIKIYKQVQKPWWHTS